MLRFRFHVLVLAACVPLALPSSPDGVKDVQLETVPSGAQVEFKGTIACTTPCSLALPSVDVGDKYTALSKHATEPVSVRFLKEGCESKLVTLTTGPVRWRSISGIPFYKYYYIPAKKFTVTLDAPEASSAASIDPRAAASSSSGCAATQSEVIAALRKSAEGALVGVASGASSGSGFFVRSDGVIVSSTTAVGASKEVQVRLSSGSTTQGSVVRKNGRYGLALVKVAGSGFPVLDLSPTAPEPGADVYLTSPPAPSAANPEDAITRAMVQRTYLYRFADWVQTDTAFDQKYSGAPLLGRNAQVVAVSTGSNPLADRELYLSPESAAVEKFLRSQFGENWRSPHP